MTNEQWQQVKEIFNDVVELPAESRFAFINQKSGGDELIFREVKALLDSDEEAADFIENPAVAVSQLVNTEIPLIGKKIGHYQIEREIGRGGMGAVYLASRADEQFEKRVAIKLIKRGLDTDDIIHRFQNERQILAALDHPNITRLLDGGATEEGLPYLVMDYVEGLPLNQFCDERQLTINDRLRLFLQICSAVTFAHQNLIIHRDIKPSNIIVTIDGTPKLLDFGLAKLTTPDYLQTLDWTAKQMMTPEYASPEQILGQSVTTATDIYSLGIVLYELLTGQRPFRTKSNNPNELTGLITDSEPQKPSSIVTRGRNIGNWESAIGNQLRGDLDNIILMAIRKEPTRRYSSVEQFASDLNRYLNGLPVMARQSTFGYRASKFVQRNKVAVAAGAGIVSALIAGLAATKRQARIAQRQRDKAEKINQFLQKMLSSANPRIGSKDVKVTEVLGVAAESIEADFRDQPEIVADLETTLGLTFLSLGQFNSAEKLLKNALDIRLKLFPRRSVETALSLHNFGKLLQAKGELKSAESFYIEALGTLRRLCGSRNLEVAKVLDNLGYVVAMRGENEEAIRLLEEELAIRREILGENHPDVARTMARMANVLAILDKRELAESFHRHALKILRKIHGREHPDIASSMSNLVGAIYQTNPEEAERLCRESLVMRRKLLGEDHADVAWSFYNLAYILINRDKFAEVEQNVRQALAKRGTNLPDENPVVASCFLLLGRSLFGQGEFLQAKAAFEECLALRLRTLPEGHWLLASTRSFLGECMIFLGEVDGGKALMLESYNDILQKLGAKHEQTRQAFERMLKFE